MGTLKTFLVGFGAGLTLAILYAPASGSATRKKLNKKGSAIKNAWNDVMNSISQKIENIREEVDELAEREQSTA